MNFSLRARSAVIGGLILLLGAISALALTTGSATARATGAARTAALTPACPTRSYPATRDPANPLMIATAPTNGNVLSGANFFVPGPARGLAAGAIAQLLGDAPSTAALGAGNPLGTYTDTDTYAAFAQSVAAQLPAQSPTVQTDVALLEKIAAEPQALRFSSFSGGGTPAAVYAQVQKLYCTIIKADPGTVPVITTYFLHPELGQCPTTAEIKADTATFKGQVNAVAQGIGNNPAALFLEIDAVGSSNCMVRTAHSITAWEALVRYEATTLEALPHTAVYLEGGYSDSDNAAYAAKLLNAMGVRKVQGFYTNGTHLQWTANELKYAQSISKLTGGARFVINTAANGRGPLLNPRPKSQGVENLCNPPGRGLGIPDTTAPGLNARLDALLWLVPVGASSGTCGGGPASGTFWVARAEQLAANANMQLGPKTPSKPY